MGLCQPGQPFVLYGGRLKEHRDSERRLVELCGPIRVVVVVAGVCHEDLLGDSSENGHGHLRRIVNGRHLLQHVRRQAPLHVEDLVADAQPRLARLQKLQRPEEQGHSRRALELGDVVVGRLRRDVQRLSVQIRGLQIRGSARKFSVVLLILHRRRDFLARQARRELCRELDHDEFVFREFGKERLVEHLSHLLEHLFVKGHRRGRPSPLVRQQIRRFAGQPADPDRRKRVVVRGGHVHVVVVLVLFVVRIVFHHTGHVFVESSLPRPRPATPRRFRLELGQAQRVAGRSRLDRRSLKEGDALRLALALAIVAFEPACTFAALAAAAPARLVRLDVVGGGGLLLLWPHGGRARLEPTLRLLGLVGHGFCFPRGPTRS
mmetsp:Transcript_5894/g.20994  ORF Transcript_5894/g.20994 Transcript_5894/m.20994 type:complete len:377 (-) Transcript_5894:21-1151(-)